MFLDTFKDYFLLNETKETTENIIYDITIKQNISEKSLIDLLNAIYTEEKIKEENKKRTLVLTRLKEISLENLIAAFRFSLKEENINDPLMLLNIMSLIKINNELDDEFFIHKDVYFNTLEDLIDVKTELKEELKEFKKQLSIYFLSLIKTYSKLTFTYMDNVIDLPDTYSNLISSMDLFTLSGIFSSSPAINTENCVYIKNAQIYMLSLLSKNVIAMDFFNQFNDGLGK